MMPMVSVGGHLLLSSYTASAVRFDASTYLFGSQIPIRPNKSFFGTFSGWARFEIIGPMWLATVSTTNGEYPVNGLWRGFNFTDDVGINIIQERDASAFYATGRGSAEGVCAPNTWYHIFAACNFDSVGDDHILKLFVNGVDVSDPAYSYQWGSPGADFAKAIYNQIFEALGFTALTNPTATDFNWAIPGLPIIVFEGFPEAVAVDHGMVSLADYQFWFNQYIDPSIPANLAKFISVDDKPVDPAIAAAAFGEQDFLLSGDASATGFRKSRGTLGDVFTLTGSLTNASTSPSD